MSVKIVIKPNTYFDSVSLMSISTRANKLDGVEQAFVAMATEMNKGGLKNLGLLTPELEQAKKSLEKREIALNEAGSIAVAALQINGVFEAAQAASQQYIENIRSLSDRQAAICAQRDIENRVEVERKLKEAEEKCAAMEYASKRKCEAMEQEAKQKSEAYWTEVSRRLQSFYENHRELKRLLDFGTPGAQL